MVRLGRPRPDSIRSCTPPLSIPLWCDWDETGRPPLQLTAHPLSIPLWCDWDPHVFRGLGQHPLAFQSHCGAIGTVNVLAQALRATGFQSHCGAIGTRHAFEVGATAVAFQSHCGAIGTGRTSPKTSRHPSFQSHCGAIGTSPRHLSAGTLFAFQSHCGAIGTGLAACRGTDHHPPFNPTVVRLGHPGLDAVEQLLVPFNPTVVRLGPGWQAGRPSPTRRLSIPLWCDWD